MERAFAEHFRGAATHWLRAPGRVDLMGSHTDYNEGFVLALAVDRDTWIAASARRDRLVRIHSLNLGELASFDLDTEPMRGSWSGLVHGVVHLLGEDLPGFDAVVHGTLPLGGGLSSSASLTVATGKLVEALAGRAIEDGQLARCCQRAEHDVRGVRCGLLDPCCSIWGRAGHALLLDCRSLACRPVPLPPGLSLVVADTGELRQLADSAYDERRSQCEQGLQALRSRLPQLTALRDVDATTLAELAAELPQEVARRCRFVVEENARVHALAAALASVDRHAIQTLCADSFQGARDLYEICTPSMEAMHRALRNAPGSLGARQAGAGFGGCLVAFAERETIGDFLEQAAADFRKHTGRQGHFYEAHAAEGAGAIPHPHSPGRIPPPRRNNE